MQLHFRRAVSALLALALLASSPALALGFIFGGEADAPAASAIEDDGMLRVYLKSLGDPASLGMTLAGSYTVEGCTAYSPSTSRTTSRAWWPTK